MKKFLFAILATASIVWISLPSCSKSSPTTVNHYDTVTVRDTLTQVDTPYAHINDSLWAWFPLNNGSLADSSGNNHSLTLNSVTWGYDLFGNQNGCLQFPGGAAYATIQDGVNFQSQISPSPFSPCTRR